MKQQALVMVVDDDPVNLRLIEALLTPAGYGVVLLGGGEECLRSVSEAQPDLILMDIMMPGMDGFALTRQLKSDDLTRMIPIVMLTSLSDVQDRVAAMEAGADDFLSKPVAKIELLARVASLIKVKSCNDLLVRSEQRYRELVQDANVIIAVMEAGGEITYMNEYGLGFFGYASQEICGKTDLETIVPEYESTGRNLWKLLLDGRSVIKREPRLTHENVTKSGRRVWVDWTWREAADPRTGRVSRHYVGVDVTEATRARQQMMRQYDRQKRRETLNEALNSKLPQPEWAAKLKQLGIKLEPPYLFCLLSIPSEFLAEAGSAKEQMEKQYHLELLIDSLHLAENGVAWQAPSGIAILQSLSGVARGRSVPAAKAKAAAQELGNLILRYWAGRKIMMGVAHTTTLVQEVTELYEQARAAMQFGNLTGENPQVSHWNDLGYGQFLVKDFDSLHSRQFVQDQLGAVLNGSSPINVSSDLSTLAELISGDSLQVIADRLHIHKQTIVFRKKKLEERLEVDLDKADVRINLAIALKVLSFAARRSSQNH